MLQPDRVRETRLMMRYIAATQWTRSKLDIASNIVSAATRGDTE